MSSHPHHAARCEINADIIRPLCSTATKQSRSCVKVRIEQFVSHQISRHGYRCYLSRQSNRLGCWEVRSLLNVYKMSG